MITSALRDHFESILLRNIEAIKPLSGGDINQVFLITTANQKMVVKLNNASQFPRMFEAEAKGLQALRESSAFTIPDVLHFGE